MSSASTVRLDHKQVDVVTEAHHITTFPLCIILLISASQGFSLPTMNRLLVLRFNRPEHGLLEPRDVARRCLPIAADVVAPPWCRSDLKAPQMSRLKSDWVEALPLAQSERFLQPERGLTRSFQEQPCLYAEPLYLCRLTFFCGAIDD